MSAIHAKPKMPFRGRIRSLPLDAAEAALVLILATVVAAVATSGGAVFMAGATVAERLLLLGAFATVAFRAAYTSLERTPRRAKADDW